MGSCYKSADAGLQIPKTGRERAALGVAEDAESALRARMPGERGMISMFKL